MTPCLCCGQKFWPGCFNKAADARYARADGKVSRFCRACRPAVNRVRMRLRRFGLAPHEITWSADQVAQVTAACTAGTHNRDRALPSAV